MKVHVSYTTDVSDDFRRALCHQWGECGNIAQRDEVKTYLQSVGTNNDEDVLEEWQDCDRCQEGHR